MPRGRWALEHGSGRAGLVRWAVFGCTEWAQRISHPSPLWDDAGDTRLGRARQCCPHSGPALTTPREFLRAINHFATTLTEMFLSDSDFELQVGGRCPSPASGQVGQERTHPCPEPGTHPRASSTAALEQLFPPGRGFPHPGLPAAGELLPGQAQQDPGQVSPHPAPGCHRATRSGILG